MLRLVMAKEIPARFGTALGWRVVDIAYVVAALSKAGIAFERYQGMLQDQLGIWTAPTGAKVAWFKDPDGNLLSISEHQRWLYESPASVVVLVFGMESNS